MRKIDTTTTFICDVCGKEGSMAPNTYQIPLTYFMTDATSILHFSVELEIPYSGRQPRAHQDVCTSCMRKGIERLLSRAGG